MKRFRWLLIINLLPFLTHAYSIETHARLTKEIVNFYNEHYSENKIDPKLIDYLVDGSRLEDDPPRWLNHFYDPVKNRGLTTSWGIFNKAKNWAQDGEKQLAFRYVPQAASILSVTQKQNLVASSNYTWQKAIDYWRAGQKEMAMNTLGHVLHLLEDMAVPDHTRNDPHPSGSPYEDFSESAKLNNDILYLKNPIELESLDGYFTGLANYSNLNFYSKDSVDGNDYNDPKPDYFKKDGLFEFGFKKDDEFGNYKLSKAIKVGTSYHLNINHPLVLNSYWLRLSTKSIQYGAGALNLFFKEANQLAKKETKKEPARGGFLASLINTITSKASDDNLKEVAVVPIGEGAPKVANENKSVPVETIVAKTSPEERIVCNFNASSTPTHQILINEVAWMGSVNSANDEWIELKNLTANSIDISGWRLIDKKEDIKISFPEDAKINANNFYLLERTDDQTIPFIVADLIYKGSLSNDNEHLRLLDKKCQLVDEALAAPNWPAGNNTEKKTMERGQDLGWHDYFGSGGGGILGTPKMENSQPLVAAGSGSAGGGSSVVLQSGSSSSSATTSTTPVAEPPATPPKILISEFLFDAEGADDNKEFIELYNPSEQAVELSGWSAQTATAKKNFESGNAIQPKSFFLIWLGSDERGDMKWASGSLNNTTGAIYLVKNQEKIEGDNDPDIIDRVSYSKDALIGFTAGRSWERKAFENNACFLAQGNGEFTGNGCDTDQATDFDLRASPNPQNTKNLPEPRSPAAFNNLKLSYDLEKMLISASWDSSSTTVSVNDVNRDYQLALKDFDPEGMPVSTTTAIYIPSFLKNLYWYKNPNGEDYFIDIVFNQYPVFASQTPAWKILNFYLNQEPRPPEYLRIENSWQPFSAESSDYQALLPIHYQVYFGESGLSSHSLILPDNANLSGSGGGIMNSAFDYQYIEDNRARIKTSVGQSSDYLTVAYYNDDWPNQSGPTLRLKAIENYHYQFQGSPPSYQPPQPVAEVNFDLTAPDLLKISWANVSDSDSRDVLIAYEIKINDAAPEITGPAYEFKVALGKIYDITIRARDEFGNFSKSKIFQWSYPHDTSG